MALSLAPSATHSPVRTKFRVSRATAFKASLSSRLSHRTTDGPTDGLAFAGSRQGERARPLSERARRLLSSALEALKGPSLSPSLRARAAATTAGKAGATGGGAGHASERVRSIGCPPACLPCPQDTSTHSIPKAALNFSADLFHPSTSTSSQDLASPL